jgi:ABC-type lipoprotein release transport system permease subunit
MGEYDFRGISFLATIYPARKAAQVQPAEALRYE